MLTLIGKYGVLSYLVAEQTREIGIRGALGADRGRVLRDVLASGASMLAVGIAVGAIGAMLASKLLGSFLYGVQPDDLASVTTAVALMAFVSLIGCYLPARRASRVDPIIALRAD